ncbi:unnamed protein product [Chrysodeixis includens]|uniref:Uncharacterized protein n=1 Tax=Chrysodeixis includens TaxID=689277 RepID=A0A9P0FSR1_CHRIL|nr:unnamed protein product [Chrysodeixis includens]
MEELKDIHGIDNIKFEDVCGGSGENAPSGYKEELKELQCLDCNDGGVGDVGEGTSMTRIVGLAGADATSETENGETGGECACCLFWSLLCLNITCGIMHLT